MSKIKTVDQMSIDEIVASCGQIPVDEFDMMSGNYDSMEVSFNRAHTDEVISLEDFQSHFVFKKE